MACPLTRPPHIPVRPRLHPLLTMAIVLGGLPFAACADHAPAASASEVTDSAGITIVTNLRPAPGATAPWTIDAEPSVSIGLLDGAEPYLLSQVRAAVRLNDGRIAVTNGGTQEVRFFDAGGTHVRTMGGEGEGPGEFMGVSGMFRLPGDSLGVWDYRSRRLTVIGPEGDLGRTLRLEESDEFAVPSLLGRLSDGSFLASAGAVFFSGDERQGLVREPTSYGRFGPDGSAMGVVLSLPGSEALVESGEGFVRVRTPPFARGARIQPGADGFVAAVTDRYELGFYDVEGTLRRLLRTDQPVRAVDDALRTAYEQDRLAAVEDEEDRATLRASFESLVYPPSVPAFSALEVDALGNVWVQDYRLPGEEGPATWLVYDPEGRILGAVSLPEGLTVFEIGEDHVLGRATDDLEVERVLLYGLHRGG